jgi:hypothetical protein
MIAARRKGRGLVPLLVALLASGRSLLAQPREVPLPAGSPQEAHPPPNSSPPVSSQAACFPACREGYVCKDGQCLSLCNPPCPADQSCVGGRRCEPALPGAMGQIQEIPPPPVKSFDQWRFFMLGFHYGFSGEVERDDVNVNALDPTIGFNLRGDIPIERYLVVGPLLQFGAWRPDVSPAPSRNYYIDVDLFLRGRIPISTASTNFQLWAGVPVGFTLDALGQEAPGVSTVGIGWNIGVLLGGAVHFTPKFGLFAELGWLQHKITHTADQNLYFRLGQWNTNLGFVFRN